MKSLVATGFIAGDDSVIVNPAAAAPNMFDFMVGSMLVGFCILEFIGIHCRSCGSAAA